jgi:hypothetical protein
MAVVVGLVGAAIGHVGFGSALTGFRVGMTIGNMFFGQKRPHQVGPRLGDLGVTSSAHGAPISVGFGTHRMNGNIIWARPLREFAVRSGGGGKGGKGGGGKGGGGQTNFRYFANFAVAFGEGVADDVLRIWANNELIFDKTGGSENIRKAGLRFRFYSGTGEQMPDGLIQADKGANLTPAYRGICYMVFEDYEVTNIGTVPNITAEIAYKSEQSRPVVPAQQLSPSMTFQTGGFAVDMKRGRAFVHSISGGVGRIRRFNLHTMREDKRQILDFMNESTGEALVVTDDGRIVTVGDDDTIGGNSRPIAVIDGGSLHGGIVFGRNSISTGVDLDRVELVRNIATSAAAGLNYSYTITGCATIFGHVMFLCLGPNTNIWDSDLILGSSFNRVRSIVGRPQPLSSAEFRFFTGSSYSAASSTPLQMHRFSASGALVLRLRTNQSSATVEQLEPVVKVYEHIRNFTPDDLIPGETHLNNAGTGAVIDESDRSIIFSAVAASDNRMWLIKVNSDTGEIIWRTRTPIAGSAFPPQGDAIKMSRLSDDTFGFVVAGSTNQTFGYLVNTQTGALEMSAGEYAGVTGVTGNRGVYDSRTESFVGLAIGSPVPVVARWFFRRSAGEKVNLADIVGSLCERSGLTALDYDVSDIDGVEVHGYAIGGFSTARQAIAPLMAAFFFDGFETDWIMKFKRRGSDPVRELHIDDFAVTDSRRNIALEKVRNNDKALPRYIKIDYIDHEIDYEIGAQPYQRTLNPVPVMASENETLIQIPVAMDSQRAAIIAEIWTYVEWGERTGFRWRGDWQHIDLDPADVVVIKGDFKDYRVRIQSAEIGANMQISFTGVEEFPRQYDSAAPGIEYRGFGDQHIDTMGLSEIVLIDGPLAIDSHEPAARSYAPVYWQVGNFGAGGWPGAVAYSSADNLQWQIKGGISAGMVWGSTVNALGNPPDGNPFKTDKINELTVAMVSGGDVPESVSFGEMLNGANVAVLLKENGEVEYIQFQNYIENDDGTFTLSNLLRGRRGTDAMARGHTAGEIIVFPDIFTGGIAQVTLDQLGNPRFYKAVTNGQMFDDADTIERMHVGRALMPYAPLDHGAEFDTGDDVKISWKRRTRIGGEWQSGTDNILLGEESEKYELEILDAPGGDVVRTVTDLDSPEYLYTDYDQAADGFTPPLEEITVRVYQISEEVGRGFTVEKTLPLV